MRNGSKYHAVILFKNTGRRQNKMAMYFKVEEGGGGGGRGRGEGLGGINKYERNNFRAKFCQCPVH